MTLVSCLCVSRPERWGQLQRAIINFSEQTFQLRELIIAVSDRTDFVSTVDAFIAQLDPPVDNVKVIASSVNSQLDGLVWAMCYSRGDYITFWDDDNLNLPDRLSAQMEVQLRHPEALTALTNALYYFHATRELFAVPFERPGGRMSERIAVTTLMGPRQLFPPFEAVYRARPAEMIADNLVRRGRRLFGVPGLPFHHLIGVTYNNLRTYDLHRATVQQRGQPAAWWHKSSGCFGGSGVQTINRYRWDPVEVHLCGSDSLAMTLDVPPTGLRWPEGLYPVAAKDPSVQEVTEQLQEGAEA